MNVWHGGSNVTETKPDSGWADPDSDPVGDLRVWAVALRADYGKVRLDPGLCERRGHPYSGDMLLPNETYPIGICYCAERAHLNQRQRRGY